MFISLDLCSQSALQQEHELWLTGQMSSPWTITLHLILTVQTWWMLYFAWKGPHAGKEWRLALV